MMVDTSTEANKNNDVNNHDNEDDEASIHFDADYSMALKNSYQITCSIIPSSQSGGSCTNFNND